MIIYYTDNFAGGREESHRLLGKALAAYTGDEQRAKALTGALKKGEHGKPFIEGFDRFSISHTGSIWAVLIAESECGLDIQTGRKCDIKAIADRWFAPDDALSITLAETDQSDAFFRIWTRREALTKALGGTVYDTGIPRCIRDVSKTYEVYVYWQVYPSGQVRKEIECSLDNAYDDGGIILVIGSDLSAQFRDSFIDLLFAEQDTLYVVILKIHRHLIIRTGAVCRSVRQSLFCRRCECWCRDRVPGPFASFCSSW